ncbi:hypothetical protein [Actinomadura mexicana]|uniref:Uncharacterized protein n=1 Tax=Actinomadura mexicana TaxID=134959 RepID=A0A238WSS2_9ACTN|nr:hypothetical protein [Actinomadura mexicana]SNR49428.1 hypothetical protein SAMN06265355_103234 [Actinomadura mexicana]
MTGERDTAAWRREVLPRRSPAARFPWLALAGAVATIVAATVLVLGMGDTLSSRDGSAGRLLPLQAASPPATSPSEPFPPETSSPRTPWPPPGSTASGPPPQEPPPAEPGIDEVLVRLRHAVDQGVAAGDVRDDVGLDLGNVIERMLDHGERSRADVASLRHKIATRAREGAITGGRAEQLRVILDGAVP